MKLYQQYIDDVLSGRRVAGRLEKLCVERSVRLWNDPRYFFDEDEADWALKVIGSLRHTKGKAYKQPFQILPWQAFFWAHIFGLKERATGKRLTRTVLLCMAKKGGKSEVAAATAILMTYFDGEPRAENYSAANKYDQASICWESAKVMAKLAGEDDPNFADLTKIFDSLANRKLEQTSDGSFFRPIAADSKTLDGVNVHFGVVDEFHESVDTSIPDNLVSGSVGREQPLIMYVTTRGFNPHGPLGQLEKAHINILEGKFEDDSTFPLIFALDDEDVELLNELWGQPFDKLPMELLTKPNPGIGVAPTMDGLRKVYTKAISEGVSSQTSCQTKNFNMWVRQAKVWVPDATWTKNGDQIDDELLLGKQCFGAYDLSQKYDITALTHLFPPCDDFDKFVVRTRFYCPEDKAEERTRIDKVPYLDWAKEGHLILTPGDIIDFEYIEEDIIDAVGKYDVVNYQYDPMFATQISTSLTMQGVEAVKFKQSVMNYNEPIEWLEIILKKAAIAHGMDPILRWMAGNVVLYRNRTGLAMFDKQKAKDRIDGMVALAMAVGGYQEYMRDQKKPVNPFDMFTWIDNQTQ